MFTQEKKTALVTGASSGMGKAIARRLIQDGYQVYVAARHVEKMADLVSLGDGYFTRRGDCLRRGDHSGSDRRC